MKYDGISWRDIGGGMIYSSNYNASNIRSYAVDSNYLFVGGHFDICNGAGKINSIARFDGSRWCSVDTSFTSSLDILTMDFIKDTLYIGGYLGPKLGNVGLAYCKNYHYTDTCSTVGLGIIEMKDEKLISISPNPVISVLNIEDKQNQLQNSTIEIRNTLGQIVFSSLFSSQIDVSNLQNGMYFLTVKENPKKRAVKIVKQ